MVIRGKEIDFKLSRLKDAGNYELALRKMEQSEKAISKEGKATVAIAALIAMLRTFFVDATGVDVLEGCDDAIEAKQAYYQFLGEVKKQKEEIITFSVDDIK